MTSMTHEITLTRKGVRTQKSPAKTTRAAFMALGLTTVLLAGCEVPQNGKVWLSYNKSSRGCESMDNCPELTDESQASAYYQYIGAEDANGNPNFSLEGWKQLYGYYTSTPIRAVYGNRLDLQFGRDMNCWEPSGTR